MSETPTGTRLRFGLFEAEVSAGELRKRAMSRSSTRSTSTPYGVRSARIRLNASSAITSRCCPLNNSSALCWAVDSRIAEMKFGSTVPYT